MSYTIFDENKNIKSVNATTIADMIKLVNVSLSFNSLIGEGGTAMESFRYEDCPELSTVFNNGYRCLGFIGYDYYSNNPKIVVTRIWTPFEGNNFSVAVRNLGSSQVSPTISIKTIWIKSNVNYLNINA